ncbi:MAG: aspartate aminotransferase family protein [Lachnospiraceae bacterium]|nr:aspartate aminotransferase family protein [Lachnospiraceae bacterium]
MSTENMKQAISEAEQVLYKAYNRYQVVFERGDGIRLYDTDGTEYLDFFAGIAVNALGYHYPGYDEAVKAQVDKFLHISNYFYNPPAISAGEKLLKVSRMEKVFFTNSGTEAVEGALKIARRYAYNKNKDSRAYEIIAMDHSFHGRSMGALSVTGKEAYRAPFEPLIPGIKFATYNDLDSVKALVNEKTCGIIVEPIQGEGGIFPATDEFLKGLREIADQNDLILIFDEIQCGMGRSGEYFAWQHSGVKPDVMTVAKALGNGVPIGAFLTSGKANTAMTPGDHGTTYGGNPLVCAAADAVLTIFERDNILENVRKVGAYLREKLEELRTVTDHIVDIRGKGMMLGVEFDVPVNPVINNALLEQHMVLINAGTNILRVIPPLVVTEKDVDEAIDRLKKALAALN